MRTGIHFHGKLLSGEVKDDILIMRIRASVKQRKLLEFMGFTGTHYGPDKPEVEITIATE